MARIGLSGCRKFKRLARTLDGFQLGFGEILGRGALELLWESAYEGVDDYLGDATDVEALAHWRGHAGVLVEALERAGGEGRPGFIDQGGTAAWPEGQPGTYRVHDLWQNCPEFIHRRLTRENERKRKGKTLSELRADAGRKGAAATNSKRSSNGRQPTGNGTAFVEQEPANGRPPPGNLPALPHPIPSRDLQQQEGELAAASDYPSELSGLALQANGDGLLSGLPAAPATPPAPTTPVKGAGIIEASAASNPVPAPDEAPARAGLPSPEELHQERYPLTERFAQHLAHLRGLTACPLSWPKRENRDRLEYLLAQVSVSAAAQAAWLDWNKAKGRGERVGSLGFFLGLLEQLAKSPPEPEPQPLSDCEPWAEILAEAVEKLGRGVVERWWSKLSARADGRSLVLTAPDGYTGRFIQDQHLTVIREAVERKGLSVEFVIPQEAGEGASA